MNKYTILYNKRRKKRKKRMERRLKLLNNNFLKDPLRDTDPKIVVDKSYNVKNKSVDFREFCSEIKNQQTLGSCSVFSVLAAYEYNTDNKFSELYLFYKARTTSQWFGGKGRKKDNVSGINIRCVLIILNRLGCCLDELWKYKKDLVLKTPPEDVCASAIKWRLSGFGRLDTKNLSRTILLNNMKAILEMKIPIIGGFKMPLNIRSEKTSKSGIVDYVSISKYGHSVMFVGFIDDMINKDQHGHLIFKNSWGDKWGDNGYGYLPYNYILNNKCFDLWILENESLIENPHVNIIS
jgi:hypothetical protein